MTCCDRRSLFACRIGGIAGLLASFVACAVLAQEAPVPAAPASPPQQTTRQEPGLFESIGRWFEQEAARLNSNMRDAREKAAAVAKDAVGVAKDAAKEAADSAVKAPGSRVVEGKQRCAMAPNGAPDCRVAADAVCRAKGFGSGKSVKTQAAQKCPVQAWLTGKKPDAADCDMEYFVTSVMCQ